MSDLQYIPLKDPGGATCGHARVRDGYLEFQLRQSIAGEALVLTGGGTATGAAGGRIPVTGRVTAAALHEDGRLLCYGVSRDAQVTEEELRRRILTVRTRPAPAQEYHTSPPAAKKEHIFAEKQENPAFMAQKEEMDSPPMPRMPEPEPVRASVSAVPATAEPEKAAQAPAPVKAAPETAYAAPASETAPSRPETEGLQAEPEPAAAAPAEPVWNPGESEPEPEPEEAAEVWRAADEQADSAAEAESFAAILRRADAVFRSILEPSFPEAAPDPYRSVRYFRPASDWHAEVDALLDESRASERVPVPNPFPHIFPNARFFRVTEHGGGMRLDGEWRRGGEHMRILAVPGSYSPQPPPELTGFNRFIRSKSGGFWVRVIP